MDNNLAVFPWTLICSVDPIGNRYPFYLLVGLFQSDHSPKVRILLENVACRWEVSMDSEEKKRPFCGPNFNDCANNTRHKLSNPAWLKKYNAIAVGHLGRCNFLSSELQLVMFLYSLCESRLALKSVNQGIAYVFFKVNSFSFLMLHIVFFSQGLDIMVQCSPLHVRKAIG